MSNPSGPDTPRVPRPPPPPIAPSLVAREIGHSLRGALIETAFWAIAFIVSVGGLGWVGYLVGDGSGLLIGIMLGFIDLGVLWVYLMTRSTTLAARVVRRQGNSRDPDSGSTPGNRGYSA